MSVHCGNRVCLFGSILCSSKFENCSLCFLATAFCRVPHGETAPAGSRGTWRPLGDSLGCTLPPSPPASGEPGPPLGNSRPGRPLTNHVFCDANWPQTLLRTATLNRLPCISVSFYDLSGEKEDASGTFFYRGRHHIVAEYRTTVSME